jgi:restriction system protein
MPKGLIRSLETRKTHLNSLEERRTSTTTWPKCSGELLLRTAKSGANAEKQFYGCSSFPKCRFMRAVWLIPKGKIEGDTPPHSFAESN